MAGSAEKFWEKGITYCKDNDKLNTWVNGKYHIQIVKDLADVQDLNRKSET